MADSIVISSFLVHQVFNGSLALKNGVTYPSFKNSIILLRKSVNMPLLIEVIDEKAKLKPLLLQIKRMVNDNGLITLQEVDVSKL
jgi:PII-like signaling protein